MTANANTVQCRSGMIGAWDSFIGPGATTLENVLMLTVAIATTAAAVFYQHYRLHQSTVQVILGAILAFDVFGGAVANATLATKRWYHRPSVTPASHLTFTSLHLTHLAILAWQFLDTNEGRTKWINFSVYAGLLMTSSVAIELSPRYLKNPVANIMLMGVLLVWIYGSLPETPGVEWMIPILFIKLLTGHAVPETPFENESDGTGNSSNEYLYQSITDR